MILVSRRLLFFHLFLTVGLLSALAVAGYLYLFRLPGPDPAVIKTLAERVLLILLCGLAADFLIVVRLLRTGKNLRTELDRIHASGIYNTEHLEGRLKRLGMLGESLGRLLRSLTDLNRKQSSLITAQTESIRILAANCPGLLLATDEDGVIQATGPEAETTFGAGREEMVQQPISSFLRGIELPELQYQFEKKKAPVNFSGALLNNKDKKQVVDLVLAPVFNDAGKTRFVFILKKGTELELLAAAVSAVAEKPKAQKQTGLTPGILSFLRESARFLRGK